MINPDKLVRLHGQCMSEAQASNASPDAGKALYRSTVRKMLGIVEQEGEDSRVDPAAREMAPGDLSYGDVWKAFRPRGWSNSDMKSALTGLAEAEGFVVMPSHFANISAFSATVGGLIDATVMEGYDSPEFVADQFFAPDNTKMDGGKLIGLLNDGQAGEDLAIGEAYPTVGLKETYVTIPSNQRRGNTIQINELDFVFDRTGKINKAATDAGIAVRRLKEMAQAKVFLGITNTYSRDGNASNTYLKTAGFIPNNYVNAVGSLPITGFGDVDTAIRTFNGNTDPGTGFEITMPRPLKIAVMDLNELQLRNVIFATEIETRTVDQTKIYRSENPLYSIVPVVLPRLYYNLLVASGVSATNAAARWYAGDWPKGLAYRTIIPFESRESPLSSEDIRRDVVLVRVAREMGVGYVKEPRFLFEATKEA